MMLKKIKYLFSILFKVRTVYAHCDVPCGIYDPHSAQVAALTVLRMMDLISGSKDAHDIARYVAVKEEHAERCKQDVRILYGDYFKLEHRKEHKELDDLNYQIMQLASKARQGQDRKDGEVLLEGVNKLAQVFWETRGIETKRVKSPYSVQEEIVIPNL